MQVYIEIIFDILKNIFSDIKTPTRQVPEPNLSGKSRWVGSFKLRLAYRLRLPVRLKIRTIQHV
jgi:hypothetical protein